MVWLKGIEALCARIVGGNDQIEVQALRLR